MLGSLQDNNNFRINITDSLCYLTLCFTIIKILQTYTTQSVTKTTGHHIARYMMFSNLERDSNNVSEHNLEPAPTSSYAYLKSDDKTMQYHVAESLKNPLAGVIP